MSQLLRFGRRVSLPSSVQILHDLLVVARNDNESRPVGDKEAVAKPDIGNATPRIPPQG